MRLHAYRTDDGPQGALLYRGRSLPLTRLRDAYLPDLPDTVEELVRQERLPDLRELLKSEGEALAALAERQRPGSPAPLLTRPNAIVAIGLNYLEHAGDLGEARPDEPATFMKPATTIQGPGGVVTIPAQSERTTGEGELALVIGRRCKEVPEADAASVVAGFTVVVDMTAEDILQRNPRFLTRAKSFDGFLVLGDELVTVDEVPDLAAVQVATLTDGEPWRVNRVAAMRFSPWALVTFFSSFMTLHPGDLLLTGTPGAAVLRHGMRIGADVSGVGSVHAEVVDAKAMR